MTNNSLYRVFHFPLCPFSRKLRIVLSEKGVHFELQVEKYWERRTEFLRMNPAGTLPVLECRSNYYLSGNYAIFEFLEENLPFKVLLGNNEVERNKTRMLTEWFDVKFHHEVTQYLVREKVIKVIDHGNAPNSEAIRIAKSNLTYHMDYIDFLLEESRYLVGDHVGLADIAAAAHLSILDYTNDISWERKPRVKKWYALLKSRPSFRQILADRIQQITPPQHYNNPDF